MSQGRMERLGGARGSEGEQGQHAMGDTRCGALGGAWLQEGEAFDGAVRSAGNVDVRCIYEIAEAVMQATGANIFHETMLKLQAERELQRKREELEAEAKAFELQKKAEMYGWNLARAADEEDCNCGWNWADDCYPCEPIHNLAELLRAKKSAESKASEGSVDEWVYGNAKLEDREDGLDCEDGWSLARAAAEEGRNWVEIWSEDTGDSTHRLAEVQESKAPPPQATGVVAKSELRLASTGQVRVFRPVGCHLAEKISASSSAAEMEVDALRSAAREVVGVHRVQKERTRSQRFVVAKARSRRAQQKGARAQGGAAWAVLRMARVAKRVGEEGSLYNRWRGGGAARRPRKPGGWKQPLRLIN